VWTFIWLHALESTHIDPSAHLDVDMYRPRVPTGSTRHPIDKRSRSPHLCGSDPVLCCAQTVMRASTDSSPGTALGLPYNAESARHREQPGGAGGVRLCAEQG
jgi:hypothetical protein